MQRSTTCTFGLGMLAALLAGGCAGGATSTASAPAYSSVQALLPSLSTQPRAAAPLADSRAGGPPLLYVSDWYGNKVVVYKQRGPNRYVRSISTGGTPPNAVAVDPSHDLWVALDTYPPNNIAVYHRGQSKPYRTLSDPWAPVSIAVAPDGTAYVTNQGNEKISVFAPGSSSPTSTLDDKNGEYSGWVALDANGNLYYTYWTPTGQGAVDEFPAGSSTATSTGISLQTGPGGIQVAADGDIVIVTQGDLASIPPTIQTFHPGSTTPASTITGTSYCDSYVGPALGVGDKAVFVGNTITNVNCELHGAYGDVKQFGYPGGQLRAKFNAGLVHQGGWYVLYPAAER